MITTTINISISVNPFLCLFIARAFSLGALSGFSPDMKTGGKDTLAARLRLTF
jgi:hypothetical protein